MIEERKKELGLEEASDVLRKKEIKKKWDNSVSYVKRLEEPDQGGPKKLVSVSTSRKKWDKMGDGNTFEGERIRKREIESKTSVSGGNLDIGKGFGVKNGAQTCNYFPNF